MMLERRNFIGLFAAATGACALSFPANATIKSSLQAAPGEDGADALIIGSGLPTDAAFALGAAAGSTHQFRATAVSYFGLCARLETCRAMRIFTLSSPANAILIEQALRDRAGRLLERSVVRPPATGDWLEWAYKVGGVLARGVETERRPSYDGHPFIAIAASL